MRLGGVPLYLGLLWDGLKRYPELLHAKDDGFVETDRALWSLSWPTLWFNLSGRLALFTDNILIALFLGPTAVVAFYLTQRVVALAGGQAAGIAGATWSGLIDLHYRGEHVLLSHRLAQVTLATGVSGAAMLLPIAAWNHDLIALWVGPDRYAGASVTWLAAGNAWALAILSVWGWLLNAAGAVRAILPVMLASAAVNLVVSTVGTAVLGLPGPLIGTTAGFLLVSWWGLLQVLRQQLGIEVGPLIWAAVRPALLALPYGLGLLVVADSPLTSYQDSARWIYILSLLGYLTAAAVGYLVLAWWLVLNRKERAFWRERAWLAIPWGIW